ncbi:MAG TPA: CHAT domain-containing protein [Dactylosporangium sp.]|nr:CHAT domain-containing protein [Dactylosporangium sp.]
MLRTTQRAIHRDDLLTLAAAADRAVGIVHQRENLPRATPASATLFDLALQRQLGVAKRDHRWAVRAQAWDHAAVLVRFCAMIGAAIDSDHAPEEMHAKALREVADHDEEALDKGLTLGVFIRYHAARDLRFIGRLDEALALVDRPVTELYGTGAEPYVAHYLYEVVAARIARGEALQAARALEGWDDYWRTGRAAGFSTRGRFELVKALARWAAGATDETVEWHLRAAVGYLCTGEPGGDETERMREVSALLTTAEFLASAEDSVLLGRRALRRADEVRARWRVLARSRAPLAVVFQRLYGDLALLAAGLDGQEAAELGLRAALSAKQTGFAARIRDGHTLDGDARIDALIARIVDVEAQPADGIAHGEGSRAKSLEELRFELAETVSPMLADTVFPPPTDLSGLIRAIGPRHALDFVELPDTLDNRPSLFRTLIEPGGRMWFERFEAGPELTGWSRGAAAREVRLEGGAPARPDHSALAAAVLPARLTGELLDDPAIPIRLLVCAHGWLSRVPWAALPIDAEGTRLVQRAVVTQCPVLSGLSGERAPRVRGRALIRLVGQDEAGVDVAREREAWGFGPGTDGVPPHACDLEPGAAPRPYAGRLGAALADRGAWQFLHIAAHGGGRGLDQFLDIPSEPLSAARALGLRWPASVLMASCHVGLVLNDTGAEPLNLVTALLIGGARCVVAGIDAIDDAGTGRLAADLVRAVRDAGRPLDVALRDAQLAALERGDPEAGWALLSAHTR